MKFEAFMTAFKAIDTNFREIFARLTSGKRHLVLENEEDPFTGRAHVRGKAPGQESPPPLVIIRRGKVAYHARLYLLHPAFHPGAVLCL